MTEQPPPYVGVLGRSGPLFDGVRRRLPRLGQRLASMETPERAGLDRAIVELGGLPGDDLPPLPPTLRPGRRRERVAGSELRVASGEPPDSQLATLNSQLDLGVVEPDDWDAVQGVAPRREPSAELVRRCKLNGLPLPQKGYVWQRERQWAWDLAWPRPRLAVVFDGGVSSRHGLAGAGWIRDASRLNEAVIEGWMVLRLTPAQASDGSGLALVARLLTSPWRRM